MVVIGSKLIGPLELAGPRVERYDGVGEEIGTGPHLAVIVGTGIADRNEQRFGLPIQRVRGPRRTAAVQRRSGLLPSLRAGLIAGRRGVERPQWRTVVQ